MEVSQLLFNIVPDILLLLAQHGEYKVSDNFQMYDTRAFLKGAMDLLKKRVAERHPLPEGSTYDLNHVADCQKILNDRRKELAQLLRKNAQAIHA